ncbi:hypothetical protein DdX_07027 [Ditylenchus destructor]|uniref:Uncharacterized protein n=1 Tax=Ditylenchus destructor TaxID=166010 RepID=A0AAD4R8K4_9BILA|nr:hypothetical protein DdX_07027 [Ditylenchus destructor]
MDGKQTTDKAQNSATAISMEPHMDKTDGSKDNNRKTGILDVEVKTVFQQLPELEILHDANRVYYDHSIELLKTYKEKVTRLYGIDCFDSLDFSDSHGNAGFSRASNTDLQPGSFIHKTFIKTNELGTEASATTMGLMIDQQHVLFIGTVMDVDEGNEEELNARKKRINDARWKLREV